MKNKKRIIILVAILIAIVFILSIINKTYKTTINVNDYIDNNTVVTKDYYYFPGRNNKISIVIYPGARVDYKAYIPLAKKLSKKNINCFIVKMPFNIPILNSNKANIIYKKYKFEHNYIVGHSLGGVAAAKYAQNNKNIEGVVLLGSYPNNSLKDKELLLIYGSEDNIINKHKYKKSKKYWPKNTKQTIIKGGNHSNFAYYGLQFKDKKSKITKEKQINKTKIMIIKFISRSLRN